MTRSCVQDDLSEPDLLSQLSLNARAGSVTPTKQQVFYVNGLIIKSGHFRDTLDTEGWQLGPSDMLPLCWLNVLWNVPRETLSLIEIMECNNIDTVMIYQMCVLIIISFRLRILNSQILKTNSKRKHPETDASCPVSTCWQPMVSGPRIMSNRHMGIIPCQTYSGSMICYKNKRSYKHVI